MEIRSHSSALAPERGHHKVQDRAGVAGEQPQGTDASTRGKGAEREPAPAWESSGTPLQNPRNFCLASAFDRKY